MKVYIDGQFYDKKDARISVFDHGLLYGDGVFEGIRIYNGKAFKLAEHIERLYQSAKAILLEIPLGKEEMEKTILNAVATNNKNSGYIRLIVTRGEGSLGIDPATCKKATVIIIVGDIQLYPEQCYENGISIVIAASRRIPSDCIDTRVKSLNYLNNIMAKMEAKQAGCLEAVMLNKEGFVTECTADNIFVVRNGALLTPASFHGALHGITMQLVKDIAATIGIRTNETTLTSYDLYNAEECYMTGTGAEIMPVVKINGRVIGDGKPGPITKELIIRFRELVMSQ